MMDQVSNRAFSVYGKEWKGQSRVGPQRGFIISLRVFQRECHRSRTGMIRLEVSTPVTSAMAIRIIPNPVPMPGTI